MIQPLLKVLGNDKFHLSHLTEKFVFRLDYTLKNEMTFLSSDNQFQYVRLIELTKSLLKLLNDFEKVYPHRPVIPTEESRELDRIFEAKKIKLAKSYISYYYSIRKDYIKLKHHGFINCSPEQELNNFLEEYGGSYG